MQEIENKQKEIRIYPKYLWFLMLSYTMVIAFANWFDGRLVTVFGLVTDAGTLIFPLTFLLSDMITEVYGYKHARRAIWCGFLFNLFFIIYGQIVIHMPNPDFPTSNKMFDTILAFNFRIIIASFISYLCSEPLNSLIMAKMKIFTNGRLMWLRFISSTIGSAALDSVIFTVIAFYGTMNSGNLIELIIVMWLIKVIIEFAGLPFSIRLANKLKKLENLDIYDKWTRFNIFKLEAVYEPDNNEYGQH